MVAQLAGHFLDGHVPEARLIKDMPGSLGAGHAVFNGHLAVFAEGRHQFHLRPETDQEAGQHDHQYIFGIPKWYHISVKNQTARREFCSMRTRSSEEDHSRKWRVCKVLRPWTVS